ncbi:MAG: PIN domain-containing protein [Oscillospiraceae bacterium]|nr:PIN domain-containing protein [Oscillospiraceae bacterium]
MNDRAFIDTNVFIYLYSVDESEKSARASVALKKFDCVISTQVLNEFSNFCIKKWRLDPDDILSAVSEIRAACLLEYLNENTINHALKLYKRYKYSFYDCLMLSSAIDCECKYIFSEDMADGQIIDDKLEIVNIFERSI